MGYSAVRELASTFYNDLEQRPEMVRQGLEKCGIEKVRAPHGGQCSLCMP